MMMAFTEIAYGMEGVLDHLRVTLGHCEERGGSRPYAIGHSDCVEIKISAKAGACDYRQIGHGRIKL
jgi:hypothetical protein